jgi:hypothetical protein
VASALSVLPDTNNVKLVLNAVDRTRVMRYLGTGYGYGYDYNYTPTRGKDS